LTLSTTQTLAALPGVPEVPPLSPAAVAFLEQLLADFGPVAAEEVKEFEATTNHDVKAVEYAIKKCVLGGAGGPLAGRCIRHLTPYGRRLTALPELAAVSEFVHFGCTSEDINNLAHALMLRDALARHILPAQDALIDSIAALAAEHAELPMLSRTHGQARCEAFPLVQKLTRAPPVCISDHSG